ncbi:MAG: polysulfide reductase NrfD [Alphaproteobacteria bacterium]|nr:polysulfide reductase NrfD [Alphaproteobacteria bacterium]
MKRVIYRELETEPGFWGPLVALVLLVGAGLGSAYYMEHHGHVVTGMDNRIVWGLPHVFAILLIVGASGALNVASVGSVFGIAAYKPMARLSALLAIALLAGGLAILVLDLGRPDRLVVAMTTFNFKSIFAWNVFLYTGFLAITVAYLYVMMERNLGGWTKPVGTLAFIWRLALTTGTGSIFGWLVARDAYNSAVMAPLFIALSLALGTAAFILITSWLLAADGRPFEESVVTRLGRLLGIFAAANLYFAGVQHISALYIAERVPVEDFLLVSGGIYPVLFWGGQVILGGLIPMALVFFAASRSTVLLASVLAIIGAAAQIYVIIIGGQAFPLSMFPGYDVSSNIFDGAIADYTPSLPEAALGLGGIAIALTAVLVAVRVLRILPLQLIGETDAADGNAGTQSSGSQKGRPAAA